MSVVVVGLSHRTAPLELLERMAMRDERLPKALGDLMARDFLSEAVVLSTCHRVEVYVVAERFHGAMADVRHFLSELSFVPPEDFSDHLYVHYDDGAVSHLFHVAAGLDQRAARVDAAGDALADASLDRIGLLEVRMAGLEDARLPPAQLVADHLFDAFVPSLRLESGVARGGRQQGVHRRAVIR